MFAEHRLVNEEKRHAFITNVSNSKTSLLKNREVVIDVRRFPRWRTGSRAESLDPSVV